MCGHTDFDGGCARRVSVQDRPDVLLGKVETILEEERPDKWELLELCQGYRPCLDKLPFGCDGVKFVYKLVWICQKVVIVVLVAQTVAIVSWLALRPDFWCNR